MPKFNVKSIPAVGHDSAPMGNRIRTFHENAMPSESSIGDLSTLEHHSIILLLNVGIRKSSDVASKLTDSSATPLLKTPTREWS